MPIPSISRSKFEFTPIEIEDQVFLAKIDRSTRFSYIKSSTVLELSDSHEFSMIMLPVCCNQSKEFIIFEKRENLPFEIVIGRYAIEVLKISKIIN